jgi:acetolactate synthase-1/2/3 large subunit
MLAITGQVPRALIGTQAFQEIDIASMAAHCTKAVYRAERAADLDRIVPEAIALAMSGRPGPVLIDVPKDVFLEACPDAPLPSCSSHAIRAPSARELRRASRLLGESSCPILYAGGGLASSGAEEAARRFCERRGIPVASTLLGLGALPSDHPLSLGMIGMHGAPAANHAIQECDLLIVAGARFDDRATGRLAEFAPRARVVRIDADASEFGRLRKGDADIHADARAALEAWHEMDGNRPREPWLARIGELRRERPMPRQGEHGLVRAIHDAAPAGCIATTDVGQHQMWAAQSWPIAGHRRFLTSGGLGTMGFGLPAAIGAALGSPGRTVVCLTGDGSILMNIQELATLAELRLPVKVCVFDNGSLGMVRQQQELFYGDRRSACEFASTPDLAAVARGFGIESHRIGDWRQGGWEHLLRADGPAFLVFAMDAGSVWPMVPPGEANSRMLMPKAA